MRFGASCPLLPKGYPEDAYHHADRSLVVKSRKAIKLSCHPDLRKLLQHLAKQLPKEIFTDLNVFPQPQDVLLRLSQTDVQDGLEKRWFSGNFNLLSEGKELVLYRKVSSNEDKEICRGNSGFLFEYIMKYCQRALPAFILTHRRGYVKHPGKLGKLSEQLKSFRLTRSVSKGLDRCSKLDELKLVDQDSTYHKFPAEHHWQGNDTVWHLGSGHAHATSQRRLGHYKTVVLIDPLLESEDEHHWKKTWQEVLPGLPNGVDVVSDVAFGDEQGMVSDGMRELVDALYEVCANRMVMVKVNVDVAYPRVKGFLVSKVRPHNLEAVYLLTPDGYMIDDTNLDLSDRIYKS